MNNTLKTLLIAMIAVYALFVRLILGWVYYWRKGDTYLLPVPFSSFSFWVIAPYVFAGVCIWGLLKGRWWAWWLTAALSAYELVSHIAGNWWLATSRVRFESDPTTLALFIKPLWLLAMIAIVVLCRWRKPLR